MLVALLLSTGVLLWIGALALMPDRRTRGFAVLAPLGGMWGIGVLRVGTGATALAAVFALGGLTLLLIAWRWPHLIRRAVGAERPVPPPATQPLDPRREKAYVALALLALPVLLWLRYNWV